MTIDCNEWLAAFIMFCLTISAFRHTVVWEQK